MSISFFQELLGSIAERGRSLGIHLLLSTQRPSGSINENIQQNTNLRLALRMLDGGESTNVIGTPEAAGPWDDVVSIFCHMPSAVRAVVFPRLVEAMAPDGVFLLEAYTPDQIGRGTGGPPDPDLLLTARQLRTELDGLVFEHLEELAPMLASRSTSAWETIVLSAKR